MLMRHLEGIEIMALGSHKMTVLHSVWMLLPLRNLTGSRLVTMAHQLPPQPPLATLELAPMPDQGDSTKRPRYSALMKNFNEQHQIGNCDHDVAIAQLSSTFQLFHQYEFIAVCMVFSRKNGFELGYGRGTFLHSQIEVSL